ncbi:MAG: LysR substrate-binding domain-containing protein [Pigmentiphaga sp.]|uniref:LysR substrate-binding domain-containing protein n=1 Tax=Pigmentiphaga sp. TaxID=1977564 RepID=UPI0029AACBF0|nr:LysR substrate-binding domain-containing protein [Pigmentiphaga sp.]MDX3904342.1 LysR substrate-binding domain-containing protein [Pigmentiphaga sp.]
MFKRLPYFLAVASEQHFGRAAQKLHMSQPPLSQQIRRFEEELGVTLFKRTTRNVELTEAGEFLLRRIEPILKEIDGIIDSTRAVHCGSLGELRFGVIATATYSIFPRLLALLRERLPQATFRLSQLSAAVLKQAVLANQIDLGIVRGAGDPSFRSKIVAYEPLFAGLPLGHVLASSQEVSMQDLKRERFVMWDNNGASAMAAQIHRLCVSHGFEPEVTHRSPQFLAMVSLVAQGCGIAIVPEAVARLGQPGVAFKRISNPDAYSEVSLIWHPQSASRLTQRFVEQVDEARRPTSPALGVLA